MPPGSIRYRAAFPRLFRIGILCFRRVVDCPSGYFITRLLKRLAGALGFVLESIGNFILRLGEVGGFALLVVLALHGALLVKAEEGEYREHNHDETDKIDDTVHGAGSFLPVPTSRQPEMSPWMIAFS